MARMPSLLHFLLLIFSTTSASSVAGELSPCHLEVIDTMTDTAAARCGSGTVLLRRGDSFRGFSVSDFSPDRITLVDSNGDRVLWYTSKTVGAPSRVRRVFMQSPQDAADAVLPVSKRR